MSNIVDELEFKRRQALYRERKAKKPEPSIVPQTPEQYKNRTKKLSEPSVPRVKKVDEPEWLSDDAILREMIIVLCREIKLAADYYPMVEARRERILSLPKGKELFEEISTIMDPNVDWYAIRYGNA